MKKLLFFLLLPMLTLAQTKQIVFDYALTYVLSPNESAKEYTIYVNSNDNRTLLIDSKEVTYLVDSTVSYYGNLEGSLFKIDYKKEMNDAKFYFLDSLEIINNTFLVNNHNTTEYKSKLFTSDNNAIYDVIFEMTSNPLESSHYLKNTPIFSYVKINIDIPRGIPSKIIIKNSEEYRVELVKLKHIERINKVIFFDISSIIDEYIEDEPEIEDTILIEKNIYNSSYKINSFEKSYTVKNIIKDRKDRKLLNKVPKYCNNLKMPILNDAEISLVLEDYVLQLCDMYLYQVSDKITSTNIDYKQTLDAIRFDINYLIDSKGRLDKKEQKKLDSFLNNLD